MNLSCPKLIGLLGTHIYIHIPYVYIYIHIGVGGVGGGGGPLGAMRGLLMWSSRRELHMGSA